MKDVRKSGFTMVEILVSILLLVVLVVGGAAVIYHTGMRIQVQGHKRVAMVLAEQRLEVVKVNNYFDMVPPVFDVDNSYYLAARAGDRRLLERKTSKTIETIALGGRDYLMTTKVLRHSISGGTVGFASECLQATVSVVYRPSTGEAVEMTTLILPPNVIL